MWCGIRVGRISLLCLVCSTVALSQTTARPDFGHGTYCRSWAYRTTPHLAHYSWTSEMEEPCFRILIAFADLSSKLTSRLWSFNRGPARSANSESLSSMIALRPSLRLTWAWHTGPSPRRRALGWDRILRFKSPARSDLRPSWDDRE